MIKSTQGLFEEMMIKVLPIRHGHWFTFPNFFYGFWHIIWPWCPKIGAHWSKNDQKDTFKDRIGLYFRLPLLADQKSKHNFSLSNYMRKGQCFMGSRGNSTWWTINDQKDTTSFIDIGKNRENHFILYLHKARYLVDQNCIQIKIII